MGSSQPAKEAFPLPSDPVLSNTSQGLITEKSFTSSVISGAAAGFAVDTILFPLDTIKTRLQSPAGFFKAGGFNGLFNGLKSAAIGSAPSAALFFGVYEGTKNNLNKINSNNGNGNNFSPFVINSIAAAAGEFSGALVRVPTDNIKQRIQAGVHGNMSESIGSIIKVSGLAGFYRGYWATILREVPFSVIQFPLYEKLKCWYGKNDPLTFACMGSATGAFAAACTTPIDVIKTRMMLTDKGKDHIHRQGIIAISKAVYQQGGIGQFFSGVVPRTVAIGLGGFIFFGAYEQAHHIISSRF